MQALEKYERLIGFIRKYIPAIRSSSFHNPNIHFAYTNGTALEQKKKKKQQKPLFPVTRQKTWTHTVGTTPYSCIYVNLDESP